MCFSQTVHSPSHIKLLVVSDYLKQLIAGLSAVAGVEEVSERNWSLECADHVHLLTLRPPSEHTHKMSKDTHLLTVVELLPRMQIAVGLNPQIYLVQFFLF